MTNEIKNVRDFLFRGLLFEAEARSFQKAGIQVGANSQEAESKLLWERLAPFSLVRRNDALEMARLYAVLFCFENEIRALIRETLEENFGPDWWAQIPPKIQALCASRQEAALKDSWLEGVKTDALGFIEFGHLSDIIIFKWELFQDLIPSQHWLKQRMDELEKARNFIAHNRKLLPAEFERIYMYVNDWNRVIGL